MTTAAFEATVVACVTRFELKKAISAYLTHFDANWILTVTIATADPQLPFAAGDEEAFAIHSPVQLLFDAADECPGQRYAFSVPLDDAGKPQWIRLEARRIGKRR